MIGLSDLEKALRKSWIRETSYYADTWTKENPAWGQCAVTALIVQDYFRGGIIRALATLPDKRKLTHYFNRLNSRDVDLTKEQIPAGSDLVIQQVDVPLRGVVLSYADTARRYVLLRQRVKENLAFEEM